jgi:hypothetical protein
LRFFSASSGSRRISESSCSDPDPASSSISSAVSRIGIKGELPAISAKATPLKPAPADGPTGSPAARPALVEEVLAEDALTADAVPAAPDSADSAECGIDTDGALRRPLPYLLFSASRRASRSAEHFPHSFRPPFVRCVCSMQIDTPQPWHIEEQLPQTSVLHSSQPITAFCVLHRWQVTEAIASP